MSVLFGVISEFEVTNTLNIFLESEIIYSEVFDEKVQTILVYLRVFKKVVINRIYELEKYVHRVR
jgi:hypothetical protein